MSFSRELRQIRWKVIMNSEYRMIWKKMVVAFLKIRLVIRKLFLQGFTTTKVL